MIGIGDAAFGRLTEQEPRGHLWIVVSKPTADGFVAVANLTSHATADVGTMNPVSSFVRKSIPSLFTTAVSLSLMHTGLESMN